MKVEVDNRTVQVESCPVIVRELSVEIIYQNLLTQNVAERVLEV